MEREEPIWIIRSDNKEMVNIAGCLNIYKHEESGYEPYRISCIYKYGKEFDIGFNKELHRDNFYDNIIRVLKPLEIDVDKSLITL